MILLVGLGNPGLQYRKTRHNAGFLVLDELAAAYGTEWLGKKFQGDFGRGTILGEATFLLKPQTYMNLSGRSVADALNFYKIPPEGLVVIHDDIDVPQGSVKARFGGSHGGNNGIRSILECLGTDKFHRIKLGVGKPEQPGMDGASWVLGTMTEAEVTNLKGAMFKDVILRLENIFKTMQSI